MLVNKNNIVSKLVEERSIVANVAAGRIKELEFALESLLNESIEIIHGKLPAHSRDVVFEASNILHK